MVNIPKRGFRLTLKVQTLVLPQPLTLVSQCNLVVMFNFQALRTSCEQLQSKKEAMVNARTEVNDTASAVCFKVSHKQLTIIHNNEPLS